MRTKKVTNAILLVIMLITISALGNKKTVAAENYVILPNGNWDFNYVTNVNTDDYYQALSGVADSAFTSKLSEIITANSVKITYGGGTNNTGDRLRYTDESPRDPSKVLLLYSGNDLEKTKLNQNSSWTWNQEHTWAKSHGFPTESYIAYSDLHHLRPTYEYINSTRSNLDFGEVEDYSGTVKTADLYGSKVISGEVFEPRDAVKGDVARMMLYMDVRYEGKKGGDPTLTLSYKTKTVQSTGNGEFGNLGTLLKWHNEDPVDDMELRRNDRIQEIQGNRNPFIDRPEFIEQVYGVEYTGTPGGGTDPDPDPEVDQREAGDVIALINEIGTVTLASEAKISQAVAEYNSLTDVQKALVTNYSILQAAIAELNELQNNQTGEDFYYSDFSKYSKPGQYAHGVTETINTKDWYFSSAYLNSGVRLGFNDCTDGNLLSGSPFYDESNPGTNRGSYFSMLWDYTDLTNITVSYLGNYGTLTRIALYVSYDQGASYRIIASKVSDLEFSSISAVILPATARIAFVIEGDDSKTVAQTAPRLDISFVQLTSKEITIKDQIEVVDTLTSMRFSYTNIDGAYSIIDGSMGLRFGVIMSASLYDEITALDPNAKFGMLVGLANMFEGYITETSEDASDLRLNVFRVNGKNEIDAAGDYYHFSLLIEDIDPESFETEVLGRGYVEVGGIYYYFRQKEISVVTLAEKYLTMNNDVVSMHEGVLRFIAKIEEQTNPDYIEFGSKQPGDSEIDFDSITRN